MVLGLLGLYKGWILALLYGALVLGACRQYRFWMDGLSKFWRALREKENILMIAGHCVIACCLLAAMIKTCAPPTDWDVLAYHLAFPKIFLRAGALTRLDWSINAHYPLNSEMIYILALGLRNAQAAQWVNFFHAALLVGFVGFAASRFFSRAHGVLAACLFAVQPIFVKTVGNAATDCNVALVSMACFYAWLKVSASDSPLLKRKWIFLCGLLSGIALSCKLTGAWVVLTLIILQLMAMGFRTYKSDLKSMAVYAGGLCCLGWPWYVKNLISTGNPVWPYLGEWFGAARPALDAWHRIKMSVTEGETKTLVHFLRFPINLVTRPELYNYPSQYLMLPFWILLIYGMCRRQPMEKTMKEIIRASLIFLAVWFWGYQNWRYFLPASGLVCILIACWCLEAWNDRSVRALKALCALALIALAPIKDLTVNNELFIFLGLSSRSNPKISSQDRYLELTLGAPYVMMLAANRLLPQNAKVLLFQDVRGYYLDRNYAWGDPLNPGVLSYSAMKDPEELYRTLKELGFTDVIYNPSIGNYKGDQAYYERADRMMDEVLSRHAEVRFEFHGLTLYHLV